MVSQQPQSRAAGRSTARGGVKSCMRALQVIEFFTRTARPARTVEISQSLSIPNSSADEILRTLAAEGYISYDTTTKLYAPSYKLVASSRTIEQNFFGGNCIDALMDDMRSELGATVYLTQQNDCWVQPVAEVRGDWVEKGSAPHYPDEMVCYAGDCWQPGTNFAAAMLTRYSNVELVDLTVRTQRMGIGPKGPSMVKRLVELVGRARARGYALCRRGSAVQVDSIAMPLPLSQAMTPYAVGIVGAHLFNSRADEKSMVGAMHAVLNRHRDGLSNVRGHACAPLARNSA